MYPALSGGIGYVRTSTPWKISPLKTSWPPASWMATLWATAWSSFWNLIENGLSAGASSDALSNFTSLAVSWSSSWPGAALPAGGGLWLAFLIWVASQAS